ncbi:MAG: tRNA (adenosine(37)-N6)-threonylcarbamoyltransferase complex dimerization subunit type 1 TsaB [Aeromicrobium sp.]|uniref:tRNA (adenosine(37)-N6)-threonylcarbamoyltransferase complex dimerization subunit type 1 TsaB n=1 Tax=Aeromicrobium sp. TaxID=1871063 RepID=UPI0039E42F2F
MLLLAFDTATPAITVAVHDGTRVVGEAHAEGATAHGEQLAPAIQAALAQSGAAPADLTDVAVGVGPGPFTGLRVGVVTALTLASTLDLTAHGVCSLDPLALAAAPDLDEPFLVATDARRREVYWARYDAAGRRQDGPEVAAPATLAERFPGVPIVGRGAELHADHLGGSRGPLDPTAAALAEAVVAGTAERLPLEPLYLRRPDAVPLDQR